mmetsp:Transcript_69819/g.195710  ORF Transcript_69819/g.195710 Transcript_69819/m.195710 type:complete len:220 (-) Transcript_69819:176-835(-)
MQDFVIASLSSRRTSTSSIRSSTCPACASATSTCFFTMPRLAWLSARSLAAPFSSWPVTTFSVRNGRPATCSPLPAGSSFSSASLSSTSSAASSTASWDKSASFAVTTAKTCSDLSGGLGHVVGPPGTQRLAPCAAPRGGGSTLGLSVTLSTAIIAFRSSSTWCTVGYCRAAKAPPQVPPCEATEVFQGISSSPMMSSRACLTISTVSCLKASNKSCRS